MATNWRYIYSTWIGVILFLSSFDDGECMGPKQRGSCDCGETNFSGPSGTVTSPYYPRNYRNNCRCTYYINVDSPNRIRLKFNDLEFADGRCQQDYIQVFDGQYRSSAMIRWFCSNRNTPTTEISQTQRLIINFRSDARGVAGGFHATYTIVSPTTNAPTTLMTTVPTTYTTRQTTRITTPSVTSSAKSTSVSTSAMVSTTVKGATSSPIFESPESTSALVITHVPKEKTREFVSTNASPTEESNLPTNMTETEAQSSFLSYAWILPIILVVFLIVFIVFISCYVKNKRSVKTPRVIGNGETDYAQPAALSADGTTVIFNQTYQSNDDFIANVVYQPVGNDIVNATTVQTESNKTAVDDSAGDSDFQASALYQTTDIAAKQPEATTHNYDRLLGDKSPSDNQKRGESVYQYAHVDKSEYQYADSTHSYDYAEAATLPISNKHTSKTTVPATYEALNPVTQETNERKQTSPANANEPYAMSDPLRSPEYMGLASADNKPYQELSVTKEDNFTNDIIYSGTGTDDGYLYPDVSNTVGKRSPQEKGYDVVEGAYAVADESGKDGRTLNSTGQSGTLPNDGAYDVVNVNSERFSTDGQRSRKPDNENDGANGETYETLNYRDPAVMNLSFNEAGYIDYNASGATAYQPLKQNTYVLFGKRSQPR